MIDAKPGDYVELIDSLPVRAELSAAFGGKARKILAINFCVSRHESCEACPGKIIVQDIPDSLNGCYHYAMKPASVLKLVSKFYQHKERLCSTL
jgi:hypothetical protein